MRKLTQDERDWEVMLNKLAIKRWKKELLTDLPLPKNYDQRVRHTWLLKGFGAYPIWVQQDLRRFNNCNKNARDKKYIEPKVPELSGDFERAMTLFEKHVKRLDTGEINEWGLYDILKSAGVMTRDNGNPVEPAIMFKWIDRRDRAIAHDRKKKLRELIMNGLSEGKNHAIIIQEIRENNEFDYTEQMSYRDLYKKVYDNKKQLETA